MPANITSITVCFGNGTKREEYAPIKKAEVTITAAVAEGEDGAVVLSQISHLALAKVADMLSAPRPATTAEAQAALQDRDEMLMPEIKEAQQAAAGEPPARRTRAPNKPKEEAAPASQPSSPVSEEPKPELILTAQEEAQDEWAAGPDATPVTDQELLSATSKRAGELGAREPIVKLIASFATRTEGAPFKVQEIPAAQRKDYLAKLAKLTA